MRLIKYFKHALYAIGFLWVGIVNLLFYLTWFHWMKKKGTFESIEWDWDCWAWKCDVANHSKFYRSYMRGWWGFVVGSFIIFVDKNPDLSHMRHEETHVLQNYIFGVLFYPLYEIMSGLLWLFGGPKINAYYHNPFEIWARWKAGQKVLIPRSEWTYGPNDRWPWKWPWE